MPHVPLTIAIVAAILILVGRVGKLWPVAVAGYAVLAVSALMVPLGGGKL